MNKYFVFVIALTLGFSAVAQKKELKTAVKELKKNNFEAAVTALDAAEALTSQMDDKSKSQYYLLRSKSLFKNGKANFSDVKKAAEALESITNSSFKQESVAQKQLIFAHLVKKASNLYKKDNFLKCSEHFESAYRLSQKDTVYLYYAASIATSAKAYDQSLSMYEELKALRYTGIEKQYFAISKEDQKEESFGSKVLRDVSVKSGTHTSPTDKLTDSKFPEIIKQIALIYIELGNNDKALEAMKLARSENPENVGLIITEANVYLKLDQQLKASELFKEALSKSPDNADLAFNIGVLSMKSNKLEEANFYLEKALTIDPSYSKAALNLSTIKLDNGNILTNEMNTLGNSKADFDRYDEIKAEKNKFFEQGAVILRDFMTANPDKLDIDILTQLRNIYSALGETTKEKDIKEKLAKLESQE